jgi:hypothetical protein
MADLEALRRLAQQHGVELDWYDIWGGRHEVPEATLRAVLGAMHVAARDDAEVHAALHDGHGRAWRRRVPPVLVVRVSVPSVDVVLRSAACCEDVPLRWRLVLEDGMEREGSWGSGRSASRATTRSSCTRPTGRPWRRCV